MELQCLCSKTHETPPVILNFQVCVCILPCLSLLFCWCRTFAADAVPAGRVAQGRLPWQSQALTDACLVQSLGLRVGGLKEGPLVISWTDPGHTVNLSSSQWFGGYFCLRIVT